MIAVGIVTAKISHWKLNREDSATWTVDVYMDNGQIVNVQAPTKQLLQQYLDLLESAISEGHPIVATEK